jgi:uncharacterized damage-inducible protein DinB
MHNSQSLLSLHERAHHNLKGLLDHCRQLSQDEINRELEGFGYATVHLQLHHTLEGERYWIGVLEGRIDVDDDAPKYPSIDKLEQLRAEIFELTQSYLRNASETELNTPRKMMTWGNHERVLIPAYVIMRTMTHIYHHTGQVAAMSRLLGKPLVDPGINFPIME